MPLWPTTIGPSEHGALESMRRQIEVYSTELEELDRAYEEASATDALRGYAWARRGDAYDAFAARMFYDVPAAYGEDLMRRRGMGTTPSSAVIMAEHMVRAMFLERTDRLWCMASERYTNAAHGSDATGAARGREQLARYGAALIARCAAMRARR